ncbi:MAG: hypothetical protein R3C59_01075 [Planctomycetaceae bacterium]
MLLTNTMNVNSIQITAGNGNVIGGVALRDCSACPAHFAERPSEKHAACDDFRDHSLRQRSRGQMSYSGSLMSWQSLWLNSPMQRLTTSGIVLGLASGRSLS